MSKKLCLVLLAGAALATTSPAIAAQDTQQGSIQATAVAAVSDVSFNFDDADRLSDESLDILRGGEALIITDQTLIAVTTGNIIDGDYTAGNVSLSDYSLSNFTGIGNFLINTGAQNSLQSGMNLTINVGP